MMISISSVANKILNGIFDEQSKEEPNMKLLTPSFFELKGIEFANAVSELDENNYIIGADISRGGRGNLPQIAWLDNVEITELGLTYLLRNGE
ncbi:YjcQ family protein [Vibrio parahaemolyticus]|nr:YjcQ family protein [Vibrio parahaemolyticus]MDG2738158.1 YjcQ family protein [Vibrio parahaemolyticus]